MIKKTGFENQGPKIGVYICHCGTNIAGSIDVKKIAEIASKISNVVIAREYRYICSDSGQELIKQDIKKFNLNKIVIAACSPTLHASTFGKCLESAGLNRYLLWIVNIREQCSWVHLNQREKATKKALELVKMAISRVSLLKPLDKIKVPIHKSCLVIGGGITGLQTALDLAEENFEVHLVEKNSSLGGHMAQLDKTFPTMDCSLCILAPKMSAVTHNSKIKVYTNSKVQEVSGYVGNFKVNVTTKPRYVSNDLCNGCGECVDVCPIEVPNEFDENLGLRKVIYLPFPQAVPQTHTIDIDHCIKCYKCVDVCGLQAIDFSQKTKETKLEIGTIIVASGFDPFNATAYDEYGYGLYDNVLTGLELERIISPSGPTRGKIIRPSDGKIPKRIAFIQCVGSRDKKTNSYCSRVCCMYAIKQALLIKEKIPDAEISIFYIDIRAFGKGYEEFYERAQTEMVYFIRGRVAEIFETPINKDLIIKVEDTLSGSLIEAETDLVVLSIGLIPNKDSNSICKILNLSKSPDGFIREAHPKLRPMDTFIEGVFIAGVAQGPKDIPDCVAQASGAAQRASRLMSLGEIEIESITAQINVDLCSKCLICLDVCPYVALIFENNELKIIETLCKGCGSCAATCPTGAIQIKQFEDNQVLIELREALKFDLIKSEK